MPTKHYQAVVIGGGVVGASILYHLARNGWKNVGLIERAELTAGSTWHAAAGFHAQNKDSNIAGLQAYTIKLYNEIEKESGQSVGLKKTGGYSLAGTKERFDSLKTEWAHFKSLGHETHLCTPEEIVKACPIVNVSNVVGGLFDPSEGRCDPHGTTHAYAGAAKKRGAEVILHNRVVAMKLRPSGEWELQTEKGVIIAEHVVNAGGLWARKVGEMVGLNLPVTPMQHHYLITEDVPEITALGGVNMPSVTDLEGFTYLQQERGGVLLGIYEQNPKHWNVQGAPWDYGQELIPEELDRITDELSVGLARFPALERVGIRKWVNGAFTFTPDGNPIVGPVPGLKNYWVACGVMAGFSQGGGVGLSLANWMTTGDPGFDVFGMDVARYGSYAANNQYLKDTTEQFYKKRFILTHPNEELPAGRPFKATAAYDIMKDRFGARFGVTYGMEFPQYFTLNEKDFVETPTQRRSNAEKYVAGEVQACRTAAGLWETAIYGRYEVTGKDAGAWLDYLMASKLPSVGRMRLATMLKPNGQLMGDLTVMRLAEDRFWITGSYYLQAWHQRWFHAHLPAPGSAGSDVQITNLSDKMIGFSLSGPKSREILSKLCGDRDLSHKALPFMAVSTMDVGMSRDAVVARVSLTGELGYEVTVPASEHRALYEALLRAGEPLGMKNIGNKALESLRHEKGYGIWSTEFTQEYTPGMCGLDKFIAFEKENFIGKEAALKEKSNPPTQRLVQLAVDTTDTDCRMLDPIWHNGKLVGSVTSGAYGHHTGLSLALGYVEAEIAALKPELVVHVVGEPKKARILAASPYDPSGKRLRM